MAADLDLAFERLPAEALAHYSWGQYRIWLAPRAAYQKSDFLLRIAAQVMNSAGQWADEQEFVSFVAILHEFVHCQQDVGTGCGHWDDLARTQMQSALFTQARNQSWDPALPHPLNAADAHVLATSYAESSVFNLYRRRKPNALRALRAELTLLPQYRDGSEADFSVDALFELDAVIAVKKIVERLHVDEASRALVDRGRNLYAPLDMSAPYRQPFEAMLGYFQYLLYQNERELDLDDVDSLLDALEAMLPLLLDIAFAHPPPAYFVGAQKDDRAHFEPGVRLLRVMRALHAARNTPLHDLEQRVERIARDTEAYRYPSLRSTYEAWAEELRPKAGSDAVAAWRLEQCEVRLKAAHALERRSLANFVSHDIPLMLDSPQWTGQRMLDPGRLSRDGGKLYNDIRDAESAMALAQWCLGGSPAGYVCPHAGGQWCDAAGPACRSGIDAPWKLPAEGCKIRRALGGWGFRLAAPQA